MSMRKVLLSFWVALSIGCGIDSEPTSPAETDVQPANDIVVETGPTSLLTVIDIIKFTREVETGVADGFDLDDRKSDSFDDLTCGHEDFVSPEGTEGVDNQLALITPLFDTVGLGAVEDFVQDAVESGGLLIMWELGGLDDLENDPDITVTLRFGTGTPLLGTDGLLLSGQTFMPNPERPAIVIPATLTNGRVETEPFDGVLPIRVFHVDYELQMKEARMRADLTYDGGLVNGVMGGKVPLENLMDIAVVADGESGGILDAVTVILDGMADMDPDENGVCQSMSAALTFSAVSGFFYEEDTP